MSSIQELIFINKLNTEIINLIEDNSIHDKLIFLSSLENAVFALRQNYYEQLKRSEIKIDY